MLRNSTPRRKAVRKGTRSCWECRRRKVKCLPAADNISICAGCRERGTECRSQQEYVDDPCSPHTQPQPAGDSALAQRVARVESLLETLVERMMPGQPGELTPESIVATTNAAHGPLSTLSRAKGRELKDDDTDGTIHKLESVRQRLAAMLPCQADVDFLFAASHGWWLLQQHMMPQLPDMAENDAHGLFNVSTVSKGHPLALARLLLCIAICIQQLPPQLDLRVLETAVPVREIESGIIGFITKEVASDDELTGSIEGVECLALLGMYAVNAGNLRRSWLLFRKAISVGQLLGLHRIMVHSPQDTMEARRHNLWYQISRGERYLSTILGLPSSTGLVVFPLDDNAAYVSPEDLYHKKLYHISGLILDRNQGDSTHSFSTTLRISEQLDSFAAQMPPGWWEIPGTIASTRTRESSAEFERIMCQIWHFELASLLHLPFMLRATSERGFEYSRSKCLNAARNLVGRWVSIRESKTSLLFSNLLEFQAFTAATTLLLGLLAGEPSTHSAIINERNEDSQLVERVVANFETRTRHLASGSDSSVANPVSSQSIQVLRTLQTFLCAGDPSDGLRLEIPFFGVIRVARSGGPAVQAIQGERLFGGASGQTILQLAQPTVASPETATIASLTSIPRPRKRTQQEMMEGDDEEGYTDNNSFGRVEPSLHISSNHFQLHPAPDILGGLGTVEWDFCESDRLFFDSLVNSDLTGDWTL